jgi:hypothetical protein
MFATKYTFLKQFINVFEIPSTLHEEFHKELFIT